MESQETNDVRELILTAGGKPYTEQASAKSAATQKGFERYEIIEIEGGFAIKLPPGTKPGNALKERFYNVRFQEKGNPNDPDDVMLSVNGETLIIQRGIKVIIPERYKICADNATYPVFRQLPGKTRKQMGRVKVFPYDLLGESSRNEYLVFKQAGDELTKQNIAKYGPNVDPEDVE